MHLNLKDSVLQNVIDFVNSKIFEKELKKSEERQTADAKNSLR